MPKQLTGPTERLRMSIAERIAKVRQEKGVTQVQMAKKLKTTQSMYSRYERGELRLHAETVLKIAQILDVTPNEIFGVTKGGHTATDPIEHSIPKRFLRKLRDVKELTRTEQDYLLKTIDTVLKASKGKESTASN